MVAAEPKEQPAKGKFKIPRGDSATIALLDEALAGRPELRRGQMFGCPGFFLGTKAVATVFGEDVTITLPPERVQALVKESGYRPFIAAGRAMSGWMLIDQEQLQRLGTDASLFDEAIAYAAAKKKGQDKKKAPAKKVAKLTAKAAKGT